MRILGPMLPSLAAIVVIATPALAVTGNCTSAHVEEPFALPDGSVHPAGRLALCRGTGVSPVLDLQRTFIDGKPVGMFASRRRMVEGPNDEDEYYLIFRRRHGGPMRLAGYARASDGRTEMFELRQPARVETEDSIGP